MKKLHDRINGAPPGYIGLDLPPGGPDGIPVPPPLTYFFSDTIVFIRKKYHEKPTTIRTLS